MALPWKNAALPRGQNPTQSPHGLSSPSPGDPTPPVADPAPEQLEVIGTGKAGRKGTCRHRGSQTDRHASTYKGTEMQRSGGQWTRGAETCEDQRGPRGDGENV